MASPLDSWIFTALKRNVQQIYLDLHLQYPSCLFNCSSLTTLKLTGIAGLDLPNSMSLPNLKTLVFNEIYFHADDDADDDYIFSKVFSSCPVLESLTLKFCQFRQTDIEICALKLKHLKIENIDWGCECGSWNEKSIKLSAPNLISIYWKDEVSTNCSINNFSALVEADIHMEVLEDIKEEEIQLMMGFLRALHNVESLRLTPKILEVIPKARALLESKPIQFCNLRCLKLRTWLSSDTVEAVTYLLKISPNIESLILELDYYKKPPTYVTYPYWDKVMSNSAKLKVQQKVGVSLQCKLYHLKSVQIRGFEGRLNEIMFLEVVLKNAMVLETLELHTCEAQISPRKKIWLSKLNENLPSFPRASSSIAISLL